METRRHRRQLGWGRNRKQDTGRKGDNEGNEMDFDDDDEEMVVPPEDEDFYGMAQKEKKMKMSKAAGHASKCGRGRKQCPNCQIAVPTCRTQCTECSYQFVIHSSSPGDEGGGVGGVTKLHARFLLLTDVWRSECLARDRSRGYQKS